jgi:hypothetical protein
LERAVVSCGFSHSLRALVSVRTSFLGVLWSRLTWGLFLFMSFVGDGDLEGRGFWTWSENRRFSCVFSGAGLFLLVGGIVNFGG